MDSSNSNDPAGAAPWEDGTLPADSQHSRAQIVLAVGIIGAILTAIFSGLRIYARGLMIRKWGADDTLLILAAIAVIMHNSVTCVATRFGLGKHVWMTSVATLLRGQRVALFVMMIYQVAFVTIKITFLLQYRRVFLGPRVELLCNIGIVFLMLFGISLLVAQGMTYEYVYKLGIGNSPIDLVGWWLANATIHLTTNIFIFILPLPLLGRLQLRTTQKLALLASFGLGILTCAVSIIRIIIIPNSFNTLDVTYDGATIIIWSIVELTCAVICCCIPTLRPLTYPLDYSAGDSMSRSSSQFDAALPPSPPGPPRSNDRISSSISCESDVVIRKPTSSFFWKRSRQQSDNSTIAGPDDIEPAPAMPMTMTVTAVVAPTEMEMPPLAGGGRRRPSAITIDSGEVSRRTRSIRSSIRSDGSLAGLGGSLRMDLSFRRRMSVALTERDSDDDIYYFGTNEEDVDMECPTPLSPPPKSRPSMSETR